MNQAFECFLPTHKVNRKHRHTLREVVEPLFPHYLFIRLGNDSNWNVIRSTRGVAEVVTFNGQPKPVPDDIVAGLAERCHLLNDAAPEPLFRPGQQVVISDGVFRELEAIVHAIKGEDRVVLLLNLLNQPQHLELPAHSLRLS